MASNVYLLCFAPRYRHAGHYAGYTSRDDVAERVAEHRDGRGAVLCRTAAQAGCTIRLARVWLGKPRRYEKTIKGRGLAPLCPLCTPTVPRCDYSDKIDGRIQGATI